MADDITGLIEADENERLSDAGIPTNIEDYTAKAKETCGQTGQEVADEMHAQNKTATNKGNEAPHLDGDINEIAGSREMSFQRCLNQMNDDLKIKRDFLTAPSTEASLKDNMTPSGTNKNAAAKQTSPKGIA